MTTTPISEEANDDDHEASDQVTTEPRRSSRVRSALEWYGNPVLEVMLLDHDEPTNYEEAMMSLNSTKWLKAMKYVSRLNLCKYYSLYGGMWNLFCRMSRLFLSILQPLCCVSHPRFLKSLMHLQILFSRS